MTQAELKEAVKTAMKAREATKLSVLRGISAAVTNELVAKGRGPDGQLTEEEMLAIVSRGAKQRKDSIEQFEKGGRPELASAEKEELAILESMLPVQMPRADIEAAAAEKAAAMGITEKSKANMLMGALMKDLKGRADGTLVKAVVDGMFS